jgi:hypothetical protein
MGVDQLADVNSAGHDDEVVTTVADEAAAGPVVEPLLLAGLGPSLRPGPDGVAVCVVRGEGPRARQALGLPEPEPGAGTPSAPSPGASSPPASPMSASAAATGSRSGTAPVGGTAARRAALAGATAPVDAARGLLAGTSPLLRTVLLVLAALVVVPIVAFFVSYKLAGG